MTLFEDRERAFEQMFTHDEEARFRALARRNRLLGQWAATQLGLKGQKADDYVGEIGRSLVARVVDNALVEKLRSDFEANGVDVSDEQIRQKMAELMAAAVAQLQSKPW
ncbi:DUF1476 domain-containing protein [Microvirga sp. Mcv34]|uniref:DUF1476 domain-containing protein n=1 Tax=Microvirga sp. Mcv34 TaxID=2926016 RepID=UPI0021C59FBF|nr:DUF1476 domain-containing protein [Microvirga sp. Mcv34]